MDRKYECSKWMRKYADRSYSNPINAVRLSKENTFEHNLRIAEVCCYLVKEGIPFYTEVRLKCGLRPDIVVPTHIKQLIEVLHTETPQMFLDKKFPKLPEELKNEVIFVGTEKKFEMRDIL